MKLWKLEIINNLVFYKKIIIIRLLFYNKLIMKIIVLFLLFFIFSCSIFSEDEKKADVNLEKWQNKEEIKVEKRSEIVKEGSKNIYKNFSDWYEFSFPDNENFKVSTFDEKNVAWVVDEKSWNSIIIKYQKYLENKTLENIFEDYIKKLKNSRKDIDVVKKEEANVNWKNSLKISYSLYFWELKMNFEEYFLQNSKKDWYYLITLWTTEVISDNESLQKIKEILNSFKIK